jgi:hypothetical protein
LHRRWLASLKFDQAVHHNIVLEDCIPRLCRKPNESLAKPAEQDSAG